MRAQAGKSGDGNTIYLEASMPGNTTQLRLAAVEHSWRQTLEGTPTQIGKLAYLASLRTGQAAQYQHYGLAQRLGEDGTSAMLSNSHVRVFREWLALPLTQQKQDVGRYLFEGEGDGASSLASWIALEPWAAWFPLASRDVERELYRGDMTIVLELLRREASVDRRDPDL